MLERTGHGKAVDWYLLGILIYEMLVGVPPFTVKTPEEMHQKLATGKMMMPSYVSANAKDLILKVGICAQLAHEERPSHPPRLRSRRSR